MYCQHCQKEFQGTGKFCPICGEKLREKNHVVQGSGGRPSKKGPRAAMIILIVLLVLVMTGGIVIGMISWMDRRQKEMPSNQTKTEDSGEDQETRDPRETDQEEQETSRETASGNSQKPDKDKAKPHGEKSREETEEEAKTQAIEEASQDTEDYILSESSSRLLTEEDIQGMTAKDLNYARNEIFARHGRRFVAAELQEFFDGKDWYEGTIEPGDFDMGVFSDIERSNISFLEKAEAALGVYYPK